MTNDNRGYYRLFELPDRWRCTLKGVLVDVERHRLQVCVNTKAQPVQWGRWSKPGGLLGRSVDGKPLVVPDPIPLGEHGHLSDTFEGSVRRRDGATWQPQWSTRQISGPVALFARDLKRLFDAARVEIAQDRDPGDVVIQVDEVDGQPQGMMRCGRLQGAPMRISFDRCVILTAAMDAFEHKLGLTPTQAPMGAESSITQHLTFVEALLDADRDDHAPELARAVRAWRTLFYEGGLQTNTGTTPRQQVVSWLEAEFGVKPMTAESNRIATLVNPEPSPGRPRKPK